MSHLIIFKQMCFDLFLGLKFGANQSFTPKEFTTCQKALVKDIPESPSDIQ